MVDDAGLSFPQGVAVDGSGNVFIADTGHNRVIEHTVHASLTFPTTGQANVNTATPFRWTDIPGGQGYQLWIGTKRGDGSLSRSGPLSANTSSYRVPALPTGVTLWARLYTEVAGSWDSHQDITFTVTGNWTGFTYPTAGGMGMINTMTPFSWSAATGAQAYQLTIGTKPGVSQSRQLRVLAPNVTDYREPALPTGSTLYARIVAKIAGNWTNYQAISFTAARQPVSVHPPRPRTDRGGPPGHVPPGAPAPAATGYQMFWMRARPGDEIMLKSGWPSPHLFLSGPALPGVRRCIPDLYRCSDSSDDSQDMAFCARSTRAARRPDGDSRASPARPTPAWMGALLEAGTGPPRSSGGLRFLRGDLDGAATGGLADAAYRTRDRRGCVGGVRTPPERDDGAGQVAAGLGVEEDEQG